MLEGIVADVLVRVLGSYVDGLNKDSIRVGVWRGDLELKHLRLRPDALAVLFETLGLDLPVTVTAGYVGLLRLEVPWKTLRSAPVRIFMHDVTVVASPVSDGDQSALELREQRLKSARLATDEAVRDAKFSMRTEDDPAISSSSVGDVPGADAARDTPNNTAGSQTQGGFRVARWGWRFTSKIVTKIVDNIQFDIENVIVQYEDASSVRDRPYTATLALDSLRACSTNHLWNPVFIEDPTSPIVHKVVYLRGLVLNWESGNSNNDLKEWILDPNMKRETGHWSGFVRESSGHAIKPMDGELRIALTKSAAFASALAGSSEELKAMRNVPRVQMDLHFPDVKIILDDFKYHTLLSTIMYLSDIDRKVRPTTAKGRWLWALDRLLPRFKERRDAALKFNAEGLRHRREMREEYCRARNAIVNARRKGTTEPKNEARIVEALERELSYDDVMTFRNLADGQLAEAARAGTAGVAVASRFWTMFSRGRDYPRSRSGGSSGKSTPKRSRSRENVMDDASSTRESPSHKTESSASTSRHGVFRSSFNTSNTRTESDGRQEDKLSQANNEGVDIVIPNFRMGFLLGRGAIELREGGFPNAARPVSSLEFGELRVGIETRPGAGLLLEALLGTFQVIDLRKRIKVMYPRAPWTGDGDAHGRGTGSVSESLSIVTDKQASNASASLPDLDEMWSEAQKEPTTSKPSAVRTLPMVPNAAYLHCYPHDVSNAICEIRGEYGADAVVLPATTPTFPKAIPYSPHLGAKPSSKSPSASSDENTSAASMQNIEDLSVLLQAPLRYIAALRLSHEEVPDGGWGNGATRMAMDLAIGGMEVLLDGPKGAFISSVTFWHPREKMPSIMNFLSRAAAPRLASLRMDIQKALSDRSVPMRMDMLIRGPRFVVPASRDNDVSLVVDFGTFAMETFTSAPEAFSPRQSLRAERTSELQSSEAHLVSVRYTDYRMACSDLGLFVVSSAGKQAAERIVRPFSVHIGVRVLHNCSYVEAMTLQYGTVDIAKVKLQAQLPHLRTSVSHDAFRQILDVVKGWGEQSVEPLRDSGIEPNPVCHSVSLSTELEEVRHAHDLADLQPDQSDHDAQRSSLISFEMSLEFEDLQLELRDSSSRCIVTVSSIGTVVQMKRRIECVDFEFFVKSFTVIDGSRGATAPFRRIAYAGVDSHDVPQHDPLVPDFMVQTDDRSFIVLTYHGDLENHEQSLAVKILSLNLLCVRETYFALADFFYRNEKHDEGEENSWSPDHRGSGALGIRAYDTAPLLTGDGKTGTGEEYSDPFAVLGMTTSGAARALREQAGRGMEFSKQALAERGLLRVAADLDGLNLTLVTADGAIAFLDVTNFKANLTQFPSGAVEASGGLGGFGVRDLTSAYEVYSETVRYTRGAAELSQESEDSDGWSLRIPEVGTGDMWLEARLRNLRIVYLQRFIVILKKYFDALKDSLKPVLEMKGGIGEVFDVERLHEYEAIPKDDGRMRLKIVTEDTDIVMPRHSQSPYEALRFFVPTSSITNEALGAPGYRIGLQLRAEGCKGFVLYEPPAEGEGRALTSGGKEPVLKQISPNVPISDLQAFTDNFCIVAKVDTWRLRKVPQVILNTDGIPVLKDGEEERQYDPSKWLPALRVRICAPRGISARLCEAEYSILYFTFTENVIERPDIEFTDIVRGLKTPVLPRRKPVQPIMFSSNRMPPNYQVLFEVPKIASLIMSGADGGDKSADLMRSEIRDVVGLFEYGVDFRMTIEVNGNVHSLNDARPNATSFGKRLIMPTRTAKTPLAPHEGNVSSSRKGSNLNDDLSRSVTFTWDRPFGFRANVMVVASDLRIIIEPELFRDMGLLTTPGFPFLKSSAPAPLLMFNGRLLLVTIARSEVWLMANQYPGDGRSLAIRGDVIAKVQWAAITGRNSVEVAANGIHINLSNAGPHANVTAHPASPLEAGQSPSTAVSRTLYETPMLYPCDVSMKFDGSGYDPPESPGGEPVKAPGSNLAVHAESILVRLDVNDAPLILAVGSHLVRMKSSALSRRPLQPGRFDQWIDKGEEGDARLAVHFAMPHGRLMFTDESFGRYVPIMEARIKSAILRSNYPWLTNLVLEFGLDLFNDEKGWWEPGVEAFPIELAASRGRSGSQAVHIRAEQNIDVNISPNTVSGAARVSKALKSAVEDLVERLEVEEAGLLSDSISAHGVKAAGSDAVSNPYAPRPSVAAFCVRNETGRTLVMWLPYDSRRRTLRGNGGEVEVDTPTEQMLWTALSASGGLSANGNADRELSMRCVLSLSGYDPVTLSTAEIGSRPVTLVPDCQYAANSSLESYSELNQVTLVWAVTMRDGVPCGCIRSVLRLVNDTNTLLEVNVGGLTKSASVGERVSTAEQHSSNELDRNAHALLKAGDSWSIPLHNVYHSIRVRPAVFHAPEGDSSSDEAEVFNSRSEKGRVCYSFKWSDPISKVSALQSIGNRLRAMESTTDKGNRVSAASSASTPVLVCRGTDSRRQFCIALLPRVNTNASGRSYGRAGPFSWIDLHFRSPLVLENHLPRPVLYKLSLCLGSTTFRGDPTVENGLIEPQRGAHIHSVGSDLNAVSLAMGMDNGPDVSSSSKVQNVIGSRNVGVFHKNVGSLKSIPMGAGRYTPFIVNLEHEQSLSTRYIRTFCRFWIRNRSDTDLFFRDYESTRDFSSSGNPKVFLRARSPGKKADRFVCFSGSWLSFQRADVTEDVWVNMGAEVNEIDKPLPIAFKGLSLLLEVRPARGRFHNTLVVTILNAVWIENRTGAVLQWCQPSALNSQGIALSAKVHAVAPGSYDALHWDFRSHTKAICLRRASEDGVSDWIWSRPVNVEGIEGEFAAKMYRPKRHEQYIARVVISKLGSGVSAIIVHKEDRNTPPYRILNMCSARSIAFRQAGVNESHPWLVKPGKSTRYSWDDPQAPLKRRSLIVEVIEASELPDSGDGTSVDPSAAFQADPIAPDLTTSSLDPVADSAKKGRASKNPKFELNIDMIRDEVPFSHSRRFNPPLKVSVHVSGPTKVVTFTDSLQNHHESVESGQSRSLRGSIVSVSPDRKNSVHVVDVGNVDVELFVKGLGVSFIESAPTELAYLSISGVHVRLDRFDGQQQLVVCEVQDVQLDNQLVHCTWPVVLWSPPPVAMREGKHTSARDGANPSSSSSTRKPFFQFTLDGPYPAVKYGIGSFRGVFVALQQLQLAADEEFVLRVWLFVVSLIDAAGGAARERKEALDGADGMESGISFFASEQESGRSTGNQSANYDNPILSRLYVEHLELCPLKLSVSFTSSRTSSAVGHIGGFRSLIRTLVAVLGNVENAEFRFNALELRHVFDTTAHFRSLITEFYVSQGSNQKMVLLASNSLIGNPSALFDSIALGTRDFFVEPANAKGSADFVASIGRGSSSLLTNTVGGLVGSIGGIPRAVAQGLETAVGDRDYLAERDSIRGGRARVASSPAQGLFTGALSFGHGIASGAAGLIRDPIQGAAEEGPSGFIKGLGKGFIGGVLKPITGALDLIAEPAAGLRSMMVSERNYDLAEPVRPPRAFMGAHSDRMTNYDLRAALGQAVLDAVNRSENHDRSERLQAWTHLVAVHPNATDREVVVFLWALMRRSTRSAQFQSKSLLDAQGNPQRAEKMRAGLVTNKRIIITSLDGHVIWDYSILDIADTQITVSAKDYLLVGLRPAGNKSGTVAPVGWQKIHCGSMGSRNVLNSALKKAIQEISTDSSSNPALSAQRANRHKDGVPSRLPAQVHRGDRSIELADFSNIKKSGAEEDNMFEMKSVHHDASADGRRGVFTDMKLPGRGTPNREEPPAVVPKDEELMAETAAAVQAPPRFREGAIRSTRIVFVNLTAERLSLTRSVLESGKWTCSPPDTLEKMSVVTFEADGTEDRATDIAGHVVFDFERTGARSNSQFVAIRFLNPLLASNAYAVQAPPGFTIQFAGGAKGDHVVSVVTLAKSRVSDESQIEIDSVNASSDPNAEPLLFGRSKVTPFPSPVETTPPHASKNDHVDPTDPELVTKLASLGFSEQEAVDALKESGADLSKAYASLADKRS